MLHQPQTLVDLDPTMLSDGDQEVRTEAVFALGVMMSSGHRLDFTRSALFLFEAANAGHNRAKEIIHETCCGLANLGRAMEVHGLKNNPELNGIDGKMVMPVIDKGRFFIKLPNKTKAVLIKPENLKITKKVQGRDFL